MEPKKLPIRLVGLDLDGTVFDSRKRISPRTAQAIGRACAMGVQVLPATGRPENGVPAQFLAIPGVQYALTSNGARVVDLREKRTVVSQLMTVQQGLEAIRAMARYDASVDVFWQGKAYADPENLRRAVENADPSMRPYIKNSRTVVPDMAAWLAEQSEGPEKISMFFARVSQREEAQRQAEAMGLEVTSSLPTNLELNAGGVNKGRGLLALAKALGFAREQVMACGDSGNDAAMLKAVGLGVAMGNATPDILAAADAVTDTNDRDGVAKALERFVLNG